MNITEPNYKIFHNTLDASYCNIIREVQYKGHQKGDRTGNGTKSRFGTSLRFDMAEGFPMLTQKEVHFKSVESELYWFINGLTNIQYLTKRKNYIWVGDAYKRYLTLGGSLTRLEFIEEINNNDVFAEKYGDMGRIYGYQWRNGKVDQLREAIEAIKHNPDSRRIIVDSWNTDDLKNMVLPPCHNQFQFWTRDLSHTERCEIFRNSGYVDIENRGNFQSYMDRVFIPKKEVSLKWNQRSVDVGLGLGFNIASYGLLLELVCRLTNTAVGEIIAHMGDTHIYNNHYEKLTTEYIKRESYKLPKLQLNNVDFSNLDCMVASLDSGSATLIGYKNDGKFPLTLNN